VENPWRRFGVAFDPSSDSLLFSVFSRHATRIELYVYAGARDIEGSARYLLTRQLEAVWTVTVPLREIRAKKIGTIYYGYRAWGPNWPYDPCWEKGSAAGFIADVDDAGNRFNPNKLLIDPYAREISHDPTPRLSFIDPNEYDDAFYTGEFRLRDTGPTAPKGIAFISEDATATGEKPRRHLKDDIIYEAHVRGLTMLDDSIPAPLRGTFRGAAHKAPYLKELGVTAVEFLPVQAFANEQNDDGDPRGDNYWGYMTLAYFSPNRRYSSDKSPGGPTREFKEMARVFHEHGIKVFLDVTYNHTGEGLLRRTTEGDDSRQEDRKQLPDTACLLSLRGLDNASYYQLRSNPILDRGKTCTRYQDNSGCGPNLKATEEAVRNLVLDSLKYWVEEMGVDGFRFDLATILGNAEESDRFRFDADGPGGILHRAVRELPARSLQTGEGVDLIAEPWALGEGTYQLGQFPDGWCEWNDAFRDTFRKAENKLGVEPVPLADIANAVAGSQRQFQGKSTPMPWHSINYLVSHDEYTLRDLFSYGGGICWDHDDDAAAQRKAVRTALAMLMLSAGVPMIMGGDELFRSVSGRKNLVAEDNESVYLDWGNLSREPERAIYDFARKMIQFRTRHEALRPRHYLTGEATAANGLKELAWYRADCAEAGDDYLDDCSNHYLGWRNACPGEGCDASSIFIGYNKDAAGIAINLPVPSAETRWYRVCDTAEWMEEEGNWEAGSAVEGNYYLHARSVAIFEERRF
jgi:isoamylase